MEFTSRGRGQRTRRLRARVRVVEESSSGESWPCESGGCNYVIVLGRLI